MSDASRIDRRLPVLLAAAGLLSSLVLEVLHLRAYLEPGAGAFCAVGARLDCTAVALSRHAVFLSIPLPLWGMAGFLALLLAALRRSLWLLPLAGVAALGSVALLLIEVWGVGAVCLLCEVVHVAAFGLLAWAWVQRRSLRGGWIEREALLGIFAWPAGLLLAALLLLPRYWAVFTWRSELNLPAGTTAEGFPYVGSPSAPLELHEFTDYACPFCKVASSHLLRRVARDPERYRLVRRHNPRMPCIGPGETRCLGLRVALCAGDQGRFWQMDRWLFARIADDGSVDVGAAAVAVGLDAGALAACVASPEIRARADAEFRAAQRAGVRHTPMYLVEGQRLEASELEARLRGR